jgi:leucyl/phenylalanyl-tRNA--protein transferase
MNERKPALPVRLGEAMEFPNPEFADAEGLVAVGGDLRVERLLAAYRQGIFPWTADPLTWWSPDPRGIIELDQFHVAASLTRVLRKKTCEVTMDRAFREVMQSCAAPGPKRRSTWIAPAFIEAYCELHQQGHAHSVECWLNGKLAGGIYGVAIGGLFAGESMFHRADNASKVALAALAAQLQARGFSLFDIQLVTATTQPFGAKEISRQEYLRRLAAAISRECLFSGGQTASDR